MDNVLIGKKQLYKKGMSGATKIKSNTESKKQCVYVNMPRSSYGARNKKKLSVFVSDKESEPVTVSIPLANGVGLANDGTLMTAVKIVNNCFKNQVETKVMKREPMQRAVQELATAIRE